MHFRGTHWTFHFKSVMSGGTCAYKLLKRFQPHGHNGVDPLS